MHETHGGAEEISYKSQLTRQSPPGSGAFHLFWRLPSQGLIHRFLFLPKQHFQMFYIFPCGSSDKKDEWGRTTYLEKGSDCGCVPAAGRGELLSAGTTNRNNPWSIPVSAPASLQRWPQRAQEYWTCSITGTESNSALNPQVPCFHRGKHFCLFYLFYEVLTHIWTAWNGRWTCNHHTRAALELASSFELKDLPMKNRIANSMCILRRKNICSNPCVSIFHGSVWATFSQCKQAKPDFDWNGFALKQTKDLLRSLFLFSIFSCLLISKIWD